MIVPVKVGNRGLRDPLEESEASHGQSRERDTREDTELRTRVTATNPDSRSGIAKLPCEEPDALMWACPDLWGAGLGNDPAYPAIEHTQGGMARARAQGKRPGRPAAPTPDQRQAARNRIKNGETIPAIAREMKTSRQTIMRVRDRG